MKIVAVISCYNEEDMVGVTVSETLEFVDSIIVMDDHSRDNTIEKATLAGAQIVVKNEINMGQGYSIRTGIERAYQEGADVVVTLDGDYQHNPKEIPLLVAPIAEDGFDVVLGSRFLGSTKHIPKMRLLFNIVISKFYRILFGFKAIDSQTGFRAFNRRGMEVIKQMTINRYDWTCEMAHLIVKNKLKLKEAKINVRYFDKEHQASLSDGLKMISGMFRYYRRKV